jgi:hypothetical protein
MDFSHYLNTILYFYIFIILFLFFKFQARRNIPYIKNILLNKDNTFEILIERNRVLSRIENVAK